MEGSARCVAIAVTFEALEKALLFNAIRGVEVDVLRRRVHFVMDEARPFVDRSNCPNEGATVTEVRVITADDVEPCDSGRGSERREIG